MTDWLVISDIHAGDVFVESERGQDALLLAWLNATPAHLLRSEEAQP